jgi:mRNA interferase MazF
VVVAQGEALNRSRIETAVCVPLTSNLRWAEAPGNVLLPARGTRLPKDSVANVSQIVTIDRAFLTERIGRVSQRQLDAILDGIALVLGR